MTAEQAIATGDPAVILVKLLENLEETTKNHAAIIDLQQQQIDGLEARVADLESMLFEGEGHSMIPDLSKEQCDKIDQAHKLIHDLWLSLEGGTPIAARLNRVKIDLRAICAEQKAVK